MSKRLVMCDAWRLAQFHRDDQDASGIIAREIIERITIEYPEIPGITAGYDARLASGELLVRPKPRKRKSKVAPVGEEDEL